MGLARQDIKDGIDNSFSISTIICYIPGTQLTTITLPFRVQCTTAAAGDNKLLTGGFKHCL